MAKNCSWVYIFMKSQHLPELHIQIVVYFDRLSMGNSASHTSELWIPHAFENSTLAHLLAHVKVSIS